MKTTLATYITHTALASALLVGAILPATATMIAQPHGGKVDNTLAMREIRITDSTKAINVARFEVVRLVNESGEKFTWQFDTLHHPIIELNKIAPAGFSKKAVLIYVGQGLNERS